MDEQKRRAASRSLDFVRPGMTLGLGSGSTAAIMVELLGERVRDGLAVSAVATSKATEQLALRQGIPLTTFDAVQRLDITIDGADEVDGDLRLIKGGGGALLREKIAAVLSESFIVIADASKQVATLGRFPLPVAVVPYAAMALLPVLGALGCRPELRRGVGGESFVTDEGNHIVDCAFGVIDQPRRLADALAAIPGVVEHGLFIDMADRLLVGTEDGVQEFLKSRGQRV